LTLRDLDAAAGYLDEALAKLDEAVHRRPRNDLLSVRAVLARARGEDTLFRDISRYLRPQGFDIAATENSAADLRARAIAVGKGQNVRRPKKAKAGKKKRSQSKRRT
jgi:hypothetical protein